MALWGNTDDANNAPKFLSTEASATWPNRKDEAFFVDITEAGVATNRAKGLKTGGWNAYDTYTTEDGDVRHRVEVIVPMAVAQGDAGLDEGGAANTTIEDSVVADS